MGLKTSQIFIVLNRLFVTWSQPLAHLFQNFLFIHFVKTLISKCNIFLNIQARIQSLHREHKAISHRSIPILKLGVLTMLVDVPGFTRSPTINMELKISDIIYASAFQKCGLLRLATTIRLFRVSTGWRKHVSHVYTGK